MKLSIKKRMEDFSVFSVLMLTVTVSSISSFAGDRVIEVYVIRTADTDGTHEGTTNPDAIATEVDGANQVYKNTGIQFHFDKVNGIHPQVMKNTFLNRNFGLPPGTNMNTPEDQPPKVEDFNYMLARNYIAGQYKGKLVVFVSWGGGLNYNQNAKKWEVVQSTGGWSNAVDPFVSFPSLNGGSTTFFAHESGHYLHLPHPFGPLPKNKAEFQKLVKTAVEKWGWAKDDIPSLFNGDSTYVNDTPPDPGPDLFKEFFGDPCSHISDTIHLDVGFSDGDSRTYTFTPDRALVMSYFKGCPGFDDHLSPKQAERARNSIDYGNRHHLIDPANDWVPPTPTPVSWGPGRVDLFVTGSDVAVRHKALTNGTWWPEDKVAEWEYQGGLIVGTPAAAAWASGELQVVVRGVDGGLYLKRWDGTKWNPSLTEWSALGGQMAGDPVVVSRSKGSLDLFALGKNGQLYYKNYPTSLSWVSLGAAPGGAMTGKPAVVSWAADRLDIVMRSSDGKIYHKAWANNSWYPSQQGWEDLGGVSASSPAIASWGPNRLDIAVRGVDNRIWHKAWTGSAWYPSVQLWEDLGGVTTDDPSITVLGSNRLNIFARGADAAVWTKAWLGRRWFPAGLDWSKLGGVTLGTPRTVSDAPGRVDVYVRGAERGIWRKSWDGQQWLPAGSDFENLGRNL